jgi:hypothetical protein
MKTTTAENRGFSDFHVHYNAIRHQILVIFITVSLLTLALIYTLELAGLYGR